MKTQNGTETMGGSPPPAAEDGAGEGAPPERKTVRAGAKARKRLDREQAARRTPYDDRDLGAPTPERSARGPVARAKQTIADAEGKIGHPLICSDTLDVMEKRGTITRRMHLAAVQFRQDFRVSNMDPQRAASMLRAGGGGDGSTVTERQEAARRRLARALDVVGGRTSPAGSVLWSVVGEERTLEDWAGANGWGCRPIGRVGASGVLVAALCALVAYYGY